MPTNPVSDPTQGETMAEEILGRALANLVDGKMTIEQVAYGPLLAYRLAVRRALLAEIVEAVEAIPRHDWSGGTLIDRNEVLVLLRAHSAPEH